MRITLALDPDVVAQLQAEMRRRRNNNFEEAINDLLRQSLIARRELSAAQPFRARARQLGGKPNLNYDNVSELLEQVEGAEHR